MTQTVCVAYLAHRTTTVVRLHGAPSTLRLSRKETKRDENAAAVALDWSETANTDRHSHFSLRIRKALAISLAPRVDHWGRDRAIQFLALLNVRGASNAMWEWNASQTQRHAVKFLHPSVRAAYNKLSLPCMLASLTGPLAARLCWSPESGGGTPTLEVLSRRRFSYQSSLAAVSAGEELTSCSTGQISATVHDLLSLRSESHRDVDLHFRALGKRKPASMHTAGGNS